MPGVQVVVRCSAVLFWGIRPGSFTGVSCPVPHETASSRRSTGMTGTTADLIPIVIIPIVVLAFWLRMMFYVDSHPRWGSQAPPDTVSTHALAGSVPVQRLS